MFDWNGDNKTDFNDGYIDYKIVNDDMSTGKGVNGKKPKKGIVICDFKDKNDGEIITRSLLSIGCSVGGIVLGACLIGQLPLLAILLT